MSSSGSVKELVPKRWVGKNCPRWCGSSSSSSSSKAFAPENIGKGKSLSKRFFIYEIQYLISPGPRTSCVQIPFDLVLNFTSTNADSFLMPYDIMTESLVSLAKHAT
jgi:hypothetical protein